MGTFGREEDIAALRRLLSDTRIVTITGRAGVGKSHLADEVAHEWSRGDVVTVSLSEVVAPDLVMAEVAARLGVALVATSDPLEAVVRRIGSAAILLVLRNVEHVLGAADGIAALVGRCPGLRVLATSQSPLQLRDERVHRLEPLPPPDVRDDLERLVRNPAVALYCDRASAVDSRFALTEANAAAVAELCRMLEGLPLAIELAAARSATLSAADAVARLGAEPLDLLRSRRGTPARHHDLRSAIGWTYAQLAPAEQHLLRRLTVPPTTFTLEDVEALGDAQALDHVAALVDFHLVDPLHEADSTRFSMPSSIRAFALDELRANGEEDDAVGVWIGWLARWSRDRVSEAGTADEAAVLRRIARATENLAAGARTALDRGQVAEAVDIALATALRWGYAGYSRSRHELLAAVLAAAPDERTGIRARLTAFFALLTFHTGDASRIGDVTRLLDEAEALARSTSDTDALLESFSVRALTSPLTGDLAGALRAVGDGLPLAVSTGDDHWIARFELLASALARLSGDHLKGLELAAQALRRSREAGYDAGIVAAGAILRPLVMRFPELDEIVPTTSETVSRARRIGMAWYDLALLPVLALEALDGGDAVAASTRIADALEQVQGSGTPTLEGFAVVAASEIAAAEGDDELALVLDAATEPYRAVVAANSSMERAERHAATLARLRASLPPATVDTAERRGRAMSLTDAIDKALERFRPVRPVPSAVASAAGVALTQRQLDVLRLLATGLRNDEIASELHLSAKTVMHHTTAIYRALSVRGRTEATAWALRSGVVGAPS